jgi:dolichol-phosphate mannosyltransferase
MFAEVMKRNDVDFVVTMDADFSHPPEYVPVLVDAVKDHDLVIGSRYVPGGRVLNWDLRRRLLSRAGNWYARRITGTPVNDMTAGFACIRLDFLRRVPLSTLHATGYAWSIEFKTMCWRRQARIKEIPITLGDRRAGQSKISTHIVYEGVIEPWRIRFSKF